MRLSALLLMSQWVVWCAPLPQRALEAIERNCAGCHGTAGGLSLLSRKAMLSGGNSGPALVPFDHRSSAVYQVASGEGHGGVAFSLEQLEDLKDWIDAGAPEPGAPPVAPAERRLTQSDYSFWAFQRPRRPPVPPSTEGNPVDALLGRQVDSPPLERAALVRRLYLDVWGIPPTPEQLAAYLAGRRQPGAWERLVDSLLASPGYGERWATLWLDIVRYADSAGYEFDWDRPDAWRYRDWVVSAFNSGMPYDRFVRLQLAGDELEPDSSGARIAAGFLRLGVENNLRSESSREQEIADVVSTIGAAFQGLTLGCARCHHHKYEPISQADYTRVRAAFASLKPDDYPLVPAAVAARHRTDNASCDRQVAALRARQAALEKPARARLIERRLASMPEHVRIAWTTAPEKRSPGQRLQAWQIERTLPVTEQELHDAMDPEARCAREQLTRELHSLEQRRPRPPATAFSVTEYGPEPLPMAGSPGGIAVLSAENPHTLADGGNPSTSGRRASFARWLTTPANPLTARVMVNRMWQRLFGEGLVATANNLGRSGARPTHAELLDWLATEFVDRGWSIKAIDRLLLTSRAYRAGGRRLRRLDAETIRDSILSTAGLLRPDIAGPGFRPYIHPSLVQPGSQRDAVGLPDSDPNTWRRSLYVFRKRSIRYPLFESLDQPDASASCDRRHISTSAPQSLILMNGATIREWARRFADRVARQAGGDESAQVRYALAVALGREPTAEELAASTQFVKTAGLADFCHAIFNFNEFLFRP